MVFLEVPGTLIEIPLYPFEEVDIQPGHLLAFTDSVDITIRRSGDLAIRTLTNKPFVIRAKANERGGYVYASSLRKNK